MFTPKNPGIPFQLISNVVNFKPPRVQMLLVFFQDHLTFLKHDLIFFVCSLACAKTSTNILNQIK